MKKYVFLNLLFFSHFVSAQQLTGITWTVNKNFFTIGQDTISIYGRNSSNNTMDFSSLSLLFNADGTYTATTLNNENVLGTWQASNGQIILDDINSSSYSLLSNGDLLLFDPFLTFDDALGTYSTPAENFILLNNISPPLPIELLNFYVDQKDEGNELTWSINESNVDYYTLERSKNGIADFIPMGDLKSRGNGEDHLYKISDKNPLPSNYYRLKIQYLDNKIEYSKILFIDTNQSKFQVLSAYPIPTRDKLKIKLSAPYQATLHVKMYDVIGNLIKTLDREIVKGNNNIDLEFDNFYIGIYFIEMEANGLKFSVLRAGKY